MLAYIALFFIGFIAAVAGSLIGLGGGFLVVPALLLLSEPLFGVQMSSAVAVGTSLTMLIFTGLSSTITYMRQGKIDYRSGWIFTLISAPSSVIGAMLTSAFHAKSFQLAFGVFMLMMAVLMLVKNKLRPIRAEWPISRTYTDKEGKVWNYGYNWWSAVIVAFVVGLISGLFGIGGGSVFVPAMVLLYAFPPHIATATSMFVILWSSIVGSATHVYLGEIDWLTAAVLIPGAIIGGWFGARAASRISSKALLWILRAALLVIAVRLIVSGLMA